MGNRKKNDDSQKRYLRLAAVIKHGKATIRWNELCDLLDTIRRHKRTSRNNAIPPYVSQNIVLISARPYGLRKFFLYTNWFS